MDNIMKVRDILKEMGYIVILKQTDSGLTANFPEKKLGINSPIPASKRFYSPIYDDESGIDFYTNSTDPPNKFVKCPAYAIRLVIASDVLSVCNYYGYNFKLIVAFDKNNKEISFNNTFKISNLVKEASNPEQLELETKLKNVLQKAIPDGFSNNYLEMAKKFDVVDGYNFVKKIISGELK